MKCGHCLVEFHAQWKAVPLTWGHDPGKADPHLIDADGGWYVHSTKCPACNRATVVLKANKGGAIMEVAAWPKGMSRPPVPTQVHETYTREYTQAALILANSPEASAAMSRRCLQRLLREKAGVKPGKLHAEITEAMKAGNMPSYVTEPLLHAIRHFGNFGAHAETDFNTNEIIDVEQGEAEWCLDILDTLFDFYFVQPAKTKARLDELQKKLDRRA